MLSKKTLLEKKPSGNSVAGRLVATTKKKKKKKHLHYQKDVFPARLWPKRGRGEKNMKKK